MVDRVCNTKEEKAYKKYVDKHIANVKKAYAARVRELGLVLSLGADEKKELKERIEKHDLSKYSDEEFEGYRQWFNTAPGEDRDKDKFNKAWEHHYTVNDHHPEYWHGRDMTNVAIAELICDWEAMSLNFGGNPLEYFEKNKEKKKAEMSPKTFRIVSAVLPILYDKNEDLKVK